MMVSTLRFFSLQYVTLNQIIFVVSKFDPGALMFDVEAGYCNITVHPSDCYLLGMWLWNQFYEDCYVALPFGLRSAPRIFNPVADMVEWILVIYHDVPDLLHYLDDLIIQSALPILTNALVI